MKEQEGQGQEGRLRWLFIDQKEEEEGHWTIANTQDALYYSFHNGEQNGAFQNRSKMELKMVHIPNAFGCI